MSRPATNGDTVNPDVAAPTTRADPAACPGRSPVARRARPYAVAPGSLCFVLTWLLGLGIARLTGAAAVVLVLAASVGGLLGALLEGRRAAQSVTVTSLTCRTLTTVGDDVLVAIELCAHRRPPRSLRIVAATIGTGSGTGAPIDLGECTVACDQVPVVMTWRFEEPGVVDTIRIDLETAGASGLIWWRRRFCLPVEPILVAPRPVGPMVPFEPSLNTDPGDGSARLGRTSGEVDGVRTWRDGEGVVGVHWPSTLRSGALIVHDRNVASDTSWTVATSADLDVGRIRFTLDEGLRAGHTVDLRSDDGTARLVRDSDDAARQCALIAAARRSSAAPTPKRSLWKREFDLRPSSSNTSAAGVDPANPERTPRFTTTARWTTALNAGLALAMLVTALDGSLGANATTIALIVIGLALGAVITTRFVDGQGRRPLAVRIGVGLAAIGAFAFIAATSTGVGGLLAALRGPLPELLMLLVVLHGFEVSTRRTMRVHQAIALIVAIYAAGLRIDAQLGWWLAAWGATLVAAITFAARAAGTRPPGTRSPHFARRVRFRPIVGWTIVGSAAAVAILVTVPIPDGPASLGLPALSTGTTVRSPGGLVGPDGSPADPTSPDDSRGTPGQAGGYRGFSETLDTSVRGDLGDGVVMRVRSPEPAFWRGQTFTEFDGRTWTVSPELGRPLQGPNISVPPTLGDQANPELESDELVQTYFVDADLPNVLFAAPRAATVIVDGTLWARPDGALRSDTTLTEGSVYTVVSRRIRVTPDVLRAQGDVSEVFASFTDGDPAARAILAPYVDLPPSTSSRTRALADELARRGASTYDTIRAYEDWLGANTEYDLNAPVPEPGTDAVDDFLFESRRGFCEQIASALTMMLRSQGVPARLATGYVPGERDRVSGVWKVRASDAHAWVEVWFPQTGWEAFDPTASVPLAGDAQVGTVGGDLVAAASSSIMSHPLEIGATIVLVALGAGLVRIAAEMRRRRRRGRWGLLQDRFTALADRHRPVGSSTVSSTLTNPRRGDVLREALGTEAAVERQIAVVVEALDRAAFDPLWSDDRLVDLATDPGAERRDGLARSEYALVAEALASLEQARPRSRQLIGS